MSENQTNHRTRLIQDLEAERLRPVPQYDSSRITVEQGNRNRKALAKAAGIPDDYVRSDNG
jgi:hypothetical protein